MLKMLRAWLGCCLICRRRRWRFTVFWTHLSGSLAVLWFCGSLFPQRTKGQANFDIEIATLAESTANTEESFCRRRGLDNISWIAWMGAGRGKGREKEGEEFQLPQQLNRREQRQQFHLVNVCHAKRAGKFNAKKFSAKENQRNEK